jgi:uncharacterized membrane protein YhaH (DUF805 family)
MTRLRRKDFTIYTLVIAVISGIISIPMDSALRQSSSSMDTIYSYLALFLVLIIIQTVLVINRLNDINLSGYYSILGFIPFINFGSVLLFFIDGTKGSNKYGDDPKKRVADLKDRKDFGTSETQRNLKAVNTKKDLLKSAFESGVLTEEEFKNSNRELSEVQNKESKRLDNQYDIKLKRSKLNQLWAQKLISKEQFEIKSKALYNEDQSLSFKLLEFASDSKIYYLTRGKTEGPLTVELALDRIKSNQISEECFFKHETDSYYTYRLKELIS